jgi:opacity protein-like surface antigen
MKKIAAGPISVAVLVAVLFSCSVNQAFAQSFGLKLAYPDADVFQTAGSNTIRTYTFHARPPKFGFTGELALPAGLLLEIDGLYSRLSYSSTFRGVDAITSSETTINCWDFPVLVKKEFLRSRIRPFVNGGAAFRAVNADAEVTTTIFPNTVLASRTRPPEFIHQATIGYAAGAGLDFKFGRYHVVPEFRYMQFQNENFRSLDGSFHSNLRQPMFMLGVQRSR